MLRLAVFEARACVLACQCAVSVSCFQISYDLIVTLLEDVLCKCLCCFVVASYLSAGAQQSFNASHPSVHWLTHAACCSKPWCACSLLLSHQQAFVCQCVFVYHVFIAAYRMFCAIAATALSLFPGRVRGGCVMALLCVCFGMMRALQEYVLAGCAYGCTVTNASICVRALHACSRTGMSV